MDLTKRYTDAFNGDARVDIMHMVRRHPNWAANRIQAGERALAMLTEEQRRAAESGAQPAQQQATGGICQHCNGEGRLLPPHLRLEDAENCPVCNGTGKQPTAPTREPAAEVCKGCGMTAACEAAYPGNVPPCAVEAWEQQSKAGGGEGVKCRAYAEGIHCSVDADKVCPSQPCIITRT